VGARGRDAGSRETQVLSPTKERQLGRSGGDAMQGFGWALTKEGLLVVGLKPTTYERVGVGFWVFIDVRDAGQARSLVVVVREERGDRLAVVGPADGLGQHRSDGDDLQFVTLSSILGIRDRIGDD